MYSKFGLDVRKDSLQTIICIRKSQVRIVLKCPQERHVSFDAQVSTAQSGTHVWRSFSLDSSVLHTFVHDILILIMPFRKGLKEILLVHSRDIADKFQQVSGRIQLGFFGQIVPYRQYLVELTRLYRAGPKGLCKAAPHGMYCDLLVSVMGVISVSSLKTLEESTLNKAAPCAVGSSSTDDRLRDEEEIFRITLVLRQRYAECMRGEKTGNL